MNEDRDAAWAEYRAEPWDTTRYASERHEGFNAGWYAAMEALREAQAEAFDEGVSLTLDRYGYSTHDHNPYKEQQ